MSVERWKELTQKPFAVKSFIKKIKWLSPQRNCEVREILTAGKRRHHGPKSGDEHLLSMWHKYKRLMGGKRPREIGPLINWKLLLILDLAASSSQKKTENCITFIPAIFMFPFMGQKKGFVLSPHCKSALWNLLFNYNPFFFQLNSKHKNSHTSS